MLAKRYSSRGNVIMSQCRKITIIFECSFFSKFVSSYNVGARYAWKITIYEIFKFVKNYCSYSDVTKYDITKL